MLQGGEWVEKIARDAFDTWGHVPIGGRVKIKAVDADGIVDYEIDDDRWRFVFGYGQTGIEAFDSEWFRIVSPAERRREKLQG